MNCTKSLSIFTVISVLVVLSEGGTSRITTGENKPENVSDKHKLPSKVFLVKSTRKRVSDPTTQKYTKIEAPNSTIVEEQLKSFSKDLVSSIMKKLEAQDGITNLASESLRSVSKSKGMTALESRRILDHYSRTISGYILKSTRSLVQPELQRLVYGICQTAAEIAIISSLKDVSWTKTMAYAHQERIFSLRRKREVSQQNTSTPSTRSNNEELYTASNSSSSSWNGKYNMSIDAPMEQSRLFDKTQKKTLLVLPGKESVKSNSTGRFLNKVVVKEKTPEDLSKVDHLVLENKVDSSNITVFRDKEEERIRNLYYQESYLGRDLLDEESAESLDSVNNKKGLSSEIVAEMALDVSDLYENGSQSKRSKHSIERLETRAEKALKYASDVAYLTASTVVAARRAITSQIEVQMAVKYVKNGLSNHQGLMINLARSAAKKAGSEARSAYKKSVACDRALGVAMKYTAQSHGSKLNNLATRIIMDTVSAASIARSMSLMASKAAMEAMFEASDITDA